MCRRRRRRSRLQSIPAAAHDARKANSPKHTASRHAHDKCYAKGGVMTVLGQSQRIFCGCDFLLRPGWWRWLRPGWWRWRGRRSNRERRGGRWRRRRLEGLHDAFYAGHCADPHKFNHGDAAQFGSCHAACCSTRHEDFGDDAHASGTSAEVHVRHRHLQSACQRCREPYLVEGSQIIGKEELGPQDRLPSASW